MSSDDSTSKQPPAIPARGIGTFHRFTCGACAKRKETYGRRLRRVRGLRTFVCAACVPKGVS